MKVEEEISFKGNGKRWLSFIARPLDSFTSLFLVPFLFGLPMKMISENKMPKKEEEKLVTEKNKAISLCLIRKIIYVFGNHKSLLITPSRARCCFSNGLSLFVLGSLILPFFATLLYELNSIVLQRKVFNWIKIIVAKICHFIIIVFCFIHKLQKNLQSNEVKKNRKKKQQLVERVFLVLLNSFGSCRFFRLVFLLLLEELAQKKLQSLLMSGNWITKTKNMSSLTNRTLSIVAQSFDKLWKTHCSWYLSL